MLPAAGSLGSAPCAALAALWMQAGVCLTESSRINSGTGGETRWWVLWPQAQASCCVAGAGLHLVADNADVKLRAHIMIILPAARKINDRENKGSK